MSARSATILVVDDDPIIRMGALEFLIEEGFEALEASSADEAILILEARQDIHVVFTDVQMPGTMDGIKLSHYVRNRWPPVKLLVASGNPIGGSLPLGARFYPKPYDGNIIVKAIIELLSTPA